MLEHQPLADREHGIDHCHVQELALAGALRAPAGRGNAVGQVHGGHDVAHAGPDLRGGAARHGASDAHDAAHRLGHRVVGGPVGVWTLAAACVAEAAQRRIHEARVLLRQRLVAQAQPLHHARTVVLDEHIGLPHEPQQRGLAGGMLQVEDQRILVAVDRGEVAAEALFVDPPGAFEVRAGAAREVATRRLDLHDVCALVGQHHRGVRAREHLRQVQHDEAFEGPRRASGGRRSMRTHYLPAQWLLRLSSTVRSASTQSLSSWLMP
ncbi:hypothetical protein D3C87_1388190 [compost metagenome]